MPAFSLENDATTSGQDPKKDKKPTTTYVNPTQADHADKAKTNPVTPTPSPVVQREGGYTPSPLSPYIAAPTTTSEPKSLVQRMLDLQYYAPNLADKPGMSTAIALDPHVTPAEMQMIAGMELAASRRLHLESLDTQMQMDVWQSLDPATQRSLLAIGYVPGAVGEEPQAQQEDGGMWGWLKPVATFWTPAALEDEVLGAGSAIGDAVGVAGDGISDAASWLGDSQVGENVQAAGIGISDSVVGDAAGAVLGGAKERVGQMVEAGMWALETPQELVFQDLRAFRILQDRDDLSFTSFNDITEAFNIAQDGNRSFDEDYLAEAQYKINDDEMYQLAVEVNSLPEDQRADWLARKVEEAGGPEGDQLAMMDMYTKLQSSKFGEAMGLVDAAHISFGRMVAQDYGLADMGDDDFGMISGALDMTARITLDPWLLAGGASKGVKAARYGINLGRKVEDAGAFATRVDEIFRLKNTRRFWEGTTGDNGALNLINTIRNTDDPVAVADAARRLKRYNGLDDSMTQAMLRADREAFPLRNADDVANFIKAEHGKAAVFTGKAAFRMTQLQKKNLFEHAIAQIKPGKVQDWLDMKAGVGAEKIGRTRGEMGLTDDMVEGGAKVTKVIDDPDLVGAGNKAAGQVVNHAWKKNAWFRVNTMITRLTTKVPVPKDGKLFLDDANSVEQISNMARTFGPRAWADQVTAAYVVANDVGRRQIYKGMMETLGEASGITRNAEGRKWWSEIVSQSVDENYSTVTGLDDIGNGQKAALYAHQLRPHVTMPEYSMLHAQAQRMGVLSKMGGHFTREGYDWFVQRAFKPSVLLRPALVLRNAGEEVLRHVVDNGPKSYLEGRMVRTHLRNGYARPNGFVDPHLADEWRFFRLFTKPAWKVTESIVDTAARRKGVALKARTSVRDWFVGDTIAKMRRGFLKRSIGEQTLKDLEELWDTSPRFRRIFAKDIMENSRAAYIGLDSAPKATAGMAASRWGRGAAGRAGQKMEWRETGGFTPKAVESHEGAARWAMRLDRLATDDFGSIAFQHLDNKELAIRLLKEELAESPLAEKALMNARHGIDEWANRIYEDVNAHFVGQNGVFQQKLFDKLVPVGDDGVRRIDFEAFDIDAIDELIPSVDDRPIHVLGRDIVRIERSTPGLISRIIDGGFDYIGESTNYISRGPLFFANMVDSLKDTRPLVKAYEEAGVPLKVINAERKAFAKKVLTDDDGVPVVFRHGSDVKYDRLDAAFATKDKGAYHVGVEFTTDEGVAKRFASPNADMATAFDPMLDDAADLAIEGHVHTVWIKKGKMLDVNEQLDLDKYEDLLRTFAKKADLDENFVNGQLFRAAQNGGGSVNDFYMAAEQATKKAVDDVAGAAKKIDHQRMNDALEGMLRSKKYKGFTREHGHHKITHVVDNDYIMPDKYPGAGARSSKWAKQQQVKIAEQRAIERTLRFVDNPVYRSQFSVIARNLFPFWRAQEEFYRRWATTFKHSPEAFRKAQLMMMGFEHSGFVQKDDEGHSYFVYPYLGEATEALRRFGEKIGIDFGMIPQVTQYSGQIRFLNQGIDPNNLQPAVSPLLAFPTGVLANLYPELQPLESAVVGEQGANRNIYTALLPTPLRRLIEAGTFKDNPDEWTAQMLSAAQNSVAALEAAGLTPGPDATADEIDAYLERVRSYTKFTLSMRAVWGALAPTPLDQMDKSPELPEHLQFEGVRTIDQQFLSMVDEMGYEKAISFWAAANPDAAPFTVSKTESVSGAFWNSTEAAGEFYQNNRELFDKHPRAATFLFPLDPEGEWSPDQFAVEMANGIRSQKDMLSFYKDVKLSGKITEWYNSKANVEKAVRQATADGDYATAARYQSSYDSWAEKYMQQNPLLEEYFTSGSSRAYERKSLIEDMRSLLDSENAPTGKATDVISEMITSYDNYTDAMRKAAGSTSYAEMVRKQYTQSFNDYMHDLAKTDDNAWLFYNRTFRYMEN